VQALPCQRSQKTLHRLSLRHLHLPPQKPPQKEIRRHSLPNRLSLVLLTKPHPKPYLLRQKPLLHRKPKQRKRLRLHQQTLPHQPQSLLRLPLPSKNRQQQMLIQHKNKHPLRQKLLLRQNKGHST
jgi:hypothetical protein